MPDDHKCCCIKWSNMAIKLIKPYIKNKFFIEQWTSNSHYMLVDSSMAEQLLQQLQPIEDITVVDTFELEFTKSTLPTYSNRASLFTVNTAPVLAPKELEKVLSLSEHILVNQNNYFLLSNSMSFGRPYILKTDGCIHDGWLVLQNFKDTFIDDFLYYLLLSVP